MKKISVCSIVKNEEKNIEKMLESVSKYDFEIVVVDTGSTDRTKEIARKYTDKVFDFEWCDDFSAAKNYAMSLAENNWILFLDADEWIERFNEDEVDYFMKHYPDAVGSVYMDNLTGTPDNPGPVSRIHIERLFNRKRFHYVSPIHEMIAPKFGKDMENLLVDIILGHSGYCMDEETRKRKSRRNLDMLFKEYEKRPDDPYLCFQIGKGYQMVSDHENAFKYFEKGLSYHPDEELDYVRAMTECYEEEKEFVGKPVMVDKDALYGKVNEYIANKDAYGLHGFLLSINDIVVSDYNLAVIYYLSETYVLEKKNGVSNGIFDLGLDVTGLVELNEQLKRLVRRLEWWEDSSRDELLEFMVSTGISAHMLARSINANCIDTEKVWGKIR